MDSQQIIASTTENSNMDGQFPYLPDEMSEEERALAMEVAERLKDPVSAAAFSVALLDLLEDNRGADFINTYFVSRMSV